MTHAKRIVLLVGSKRAISEAVRTEGAGRRYAALAHRLQWRTTAGTISSRQPQAR